MAVLSGHGAVEGSAPDRFSGTVEAARMPQDAVNRVPQAFLHKLVGFDWVRTSANDRGNRVIERWSDLGARCRVGRRLWREHWRSGRRKGAVVESVVVWVHCELSGRNPTPIETRAAGEGGPQSSGLTPLTKQSIGDCMESPATRRRLGRGGRTQLQCADGAVRDNAAFSPGACRVLSERCRVAAVTSIARCFSRISRRCIALAEVGIPLPFPHG
jgi:hypothetical protein